ncbi:hypothetical protein SteCoe_10419 [Stentor coeruleus]|uniref:CKK domain-containing protein n=1 Tax=Stentor coeruleus TaxID=5963 RepID=A0A1R2CFH4_9CILI|nr:hypothetical protein SteCoe_10419 [Stentor coeruleus]
MNKHCYMDHEDLHSLQNEESFEENYEDMINSYLSQRHIYSASLPLPTTTDSVIEQIQFENTQKLFRKESLKYQLKQQLLQLVKPPSPHNQEIEKKLTIEFTDEAPENMVEIVEVTSSAEQSPTALKSLENKIENVSVDNMDTDEFTELSIDVSQEIKYFLYRPSDIKVIPIMKNKFFPVSEMFKRNKSRMIKIVSCSKDFKGENKTLRKKACKIIENCPNKSYVIVFSPINKKKLGIFTIHNEKAVKILGDDLPDCIPLTKINKKFTFDFNERIFVENSQIVDGVDFSEELLS